MKIKILIAPVLIVFAIWMIIWVISPEYEQLKNDRQKLSEAREKLEDIQKKNRRVEKLSHDLSDNAETQDILLRYVPSSQKEEEIVDNINYIASREGLSIYQISVENKKNEQLATAPVLQAGAPFVSGSSDVDIASSEGAAANQETSPEPAPKNMEIKLELAGTYDKIRSFSHKLSTLRRFNSVMSMNIQEKESESPEEDFPTGILKAEVLVAFNYMEKIASVNNINDRVFYSDKFDISVIDDIKNRMSTNLVDLELVPGGRENPFIPN